MCFRLLSLNARGSAGNSGRTEKPLARPMAERVVSLPTSHRSSLTPERQNLKDAED